MRYVDRVLNYIKEYQLICPGDHVAVGFSGGADSLFLLTALQELRESLACRLTAIHVNHCLRGEESEEDEAFCRQVCRQADLPLLVFREDIRSRGEALQLGEEETGRLVRRQIWEDCRSRHGITAIALAHHANDRAETFLFHAARGSSLAGVASIRPRSGSIIHPLLCLERREIEEALREAGLSWRTDSSNLTSEPVRNRIRHEVLPLLTAQVNTGAVRHISALADDLMEADQLLKELAGKAEEQMVSVSGGGRKGTCGERFSEKQQKVSLFISEKVMELPGLLQRYILMDCLEQAAGARKDLGRTQLAQLQGLLFLQTGRKLQLPGGVAAERTYEGICLGPVREEDRGLLKPIPLLEKPEWIWGSYAVKWHLQENRGQKIGDFKYTKYFDYDKINRSLTLRSRQPGDYMVIDPEGDRKKLNRILIDGKVPREQRELLPVLASGSGVFWVCGQRVSEDSRVSPETKNILVLQLTPLTEGETDGKQD